MTKRDKLMEKLKRGTIKADELRTLLKQEGWIKRKGKGSHEVWAMHGETLVLATHDKDLKRYQIKEAQEVLINDTANEEEE